MSLCCTYIVPEQVEKYHDENWSLNHDEAGVGKLISRCVEPSCAAKQCVGGFLAPAPPAPPTTSNVSFSLLVRNDAGTTIAGTANISIVALGFSTAVEVVLPPGKAQQLSVYITDEQQLSRISPGTTRVAVALAGSTQVADAVRWSSPPGCSDSATIRPLDLSQAFNFDAEELYSAASMASRWRLDYTGVGIGIEAQLRYNNTARIHAQRPGHPIAIDDSAPYRGYYLDSPPITNLGYGNLPEQMCHSGIGQGHCNNNPGLNTGLVPNGTRNDSMTCNVWRSTAGQWLLPLFSSWSDFHPVGLAPSLSFKTGRKGERNILALIASQVRHQPSSVCIHILQSLRESVLFGNYLHNRVRMHTAFRLLFVVRCAHTTGCQCAPDVKALLADCESTEIAQVLHASC